MAKRIKYVDNNLIEYDILNLVDQYDPILRKPTIPFNFESPTRGQALIRAEYLAHTLSETLSKLEGLGLSANQIGLTDRVFAINVGDSIWILFNPVILEKSEELSTYSEGCLSFPGLYLKIGRSAHIKVRFQAIGGQEVEQEFDGLTAVCVQHEIDHLDGKVYTDLISPIKLEQAKRKVKTTLKKMKKARVA